MSGTTALVVAVPEARHVVRAAGGDVSRRPLHRPQPPHVTILWPFLPARDVDEAVHARLTRLFGGFAAFDTTFTSIGSFPGVTYLAPSDPEPFRALTRAVHEAWPDHPPYGGAYDEIVPHITLGEGTRNKRIAELLPVAARVGQVELTVDHRWRGWRGRARYLLRPADPA